MAFQISYGGDETDILSSALAKCAQGRYVVRIEHNDGMATGEVTDMANNGAHTSVTLADWDDEDQATGTETTVDINDISFLEIY